MVSDGSGGHSAWAQVNVPEIRDYHLINLEVVSLLNGGATRVALHGVETQRLLMARVRGSWKALVVIDGKAGPEVAAELDAPGLTVVCQGSTLDGAGRSLRSGRLVILGDSRDGLGYAQEGGEIIVRGDVGHRAGLLQAGGRLIVTGSLGRLAGERQCDGSIVHLGSSIGPARSRGRIGGKFLGSGDPEIEKIRVELAPWLDDGSPPHPYPGIDSREVML